MKRLILIGLMTSLVFCLSYCKKGLPTTPDIPELLKPEIEFFKANPGQITRGESSTLSWETSNATKVVIDNGIGEVDLTGSREVTPQETITYALTASNKDGQVSQSVEVIVRDPEKPPKIEKFEANPGQITRGESSTLSWETSNATKVVINGIGEVDLTGSREVTPQETITYALTASNEAGQVSQSVKVIVREPEPPTIIYFIASDYEINIPDEKSTVLSWEVKKATKVVINNGIDEVDLTGSREVTPQETTTYALTASNKDGQVSQSVEVIVNRPEHLVVFVGEPVYQDLGQDKGCRYIITVKNVGKQTCYRVMVGVYIYKSSGDLLVAKRAYLADSPDRTTTDLLAGQTAEYRADYTEYYKNLLDKTKTKFEVGWREN